MSRDKGELLGVPVDMAAGKTQPGLRESQSYALGGAPGAWAGGWVSGWILGNSASAARAECLSFADYGGFCPQLLFWIISSVRDSRMEGDRGVIFN